MQNPFDTTITPTAVGQSVRFWGYGGYVRQWMLDCAPGVVVRFTRAGSPVIRFEGNGYSPGVHTISDTFGCARVILDDGSWARP